MSIKSQLRYGFLALLLALAACAPYSLVPPAPTDVANFRVETDIAWNKANQLRIESSAPIAYWTADGPSLNAIMFIGGVKNGEVLLRVPGSSETETLVFRDSMAPGEIVELWESTIAKLNNTTIAEGRNVRPVKFGGGDGFSFDFSYVTKDEVDRRGIGYAAVRDGRLYMIFYSGTKLHHYGLRLPSAMRIIETAQIGG